jgi:2-hydroxy-6-oxonona-2,4-dienedioate hydrolase
VTTTDRTDTRLTPRRTRAAGLDVFSLVDDGEIDGPPVVLLHGVGVSSRNMAPTAAALAHRCRVYVPDLPGHGRTSKPDHPLRLPEHARVLTAWLDAVGLARVDVLGNSYGCQVAVELAVQSPERVHRVALQGPIVDPAASHWLTQIWRWLRNGRLEPSTQADTTFGDWKAAGLRTMVTTARDSIQYPIEDKLRRVTQPTLVVRGTRDPIVPQRWAERAAELLPDGRLVVVPGASHTITTTRPNELATIVERFLFENAPAT